MSYNFAWYIRNAPTASGGTAVTQWFKQFRIPVIEATAARRAGIYQIPFRDGYYQPVVDEYFDGTALIADGFLKRSTSNSTGVGDHRHILRNAEDWTNAINNATNETWIGYNNPTHGRLERRVRPAGAPTVMDAPWRVRTVLTCVDAFWREEADSTGNTGTFSVSGTAPVGDGTLLWQGTTGTVTHTATSDVITLTASPSTAGILFDFGAGTVTKSSDGSAFTSYTVNSGRWLRLQPGSNTLTPSAGVSIDFDYYPKHR